MSRGVDPVDPRGAGTSPRGYRLARPTHLPGIVEAPGRPSAADSRAIRNSTTADLKTVTTDSLGFRNDRSTLRPSRALKRESHWERVGASTHRSQVTANLRLFKRRSSPCVTARLRESGRRFHAGKERVDIRGPGRRFVHVLSHLKFLRGASTDVVDTWLVQARSPRPVNRLPPCFAPRSPVC